MVRSISTACSLDIDGSGSGRQRAFGQLANGPFNRVSEVRKLPVSCNSRSGLHFALRSRKSKPASIRPKVDCHLFAELL